ncbi:hypothetical protein SAMN06269185_3263 [Natronoarchaeum philippinense]|uniref:Uncharacterized protein n=1 Tax=Natronoarchaeum philippinense TaxID=558529 RepID=A0A285P8V7_NATPI|nr:hypothetical protein [Natronoarchaeum philippinense]SNZ18152.1 hypothetical protein SAMN06269185_3263 [Natronoarchaeum philippinense]
MPDLPDGATEDETERDGFLSYAIEWHAFAHGVYDGMRTPKARPGELPDIEDVQQEPHYFKGGYVIGTLLQLLILAAFGSALF